MFLTGPEQEGHAPGRQPEKSSNAERVNESRTYRRPRSWSKEACENA